MTALNCAPAETPVVPAKPKRPRPGGLTYTQAELAWALGISMRLLRRIQYRLPQPLKSISAKPLWSRSAIAEWVESGGRGRRK